MRVWVTRPAAQAGTWLQALRMQGHDAIALPLIQIGAPSRPDAVLAAWQGLHQWQVLMFVSANAVEQFFALRPDRASACSQGTRWWATGPATVAALEAAGVATSQIDAPDPSSATFDSEALWKHVQARRYAGARVLIVRGNSVHAPGADAAQGAGRDWLAQRLTEEGARVEFVVAYERLVPVLSAHTLALVQGASADGSVWLFSSSEAVTNLVAAAAGVHWGAARAIATHPRIANAARAAGFGSVLESRPALAAVMASIELLA